MIANNNNMFNPPQYTGNGDLTVGSYIAVDTSENHDAYIWASTKKAVEINAESILQFEDGTSMTGELLIKCLRALYNIIEKDYPEELL